MVLWYGLCVCLCVYVCEGSMGRRRMCEMVVFVVEAVESHMCASASMAMRGQVGYVVGIQHL